MGPDGLGRGEISPPEDLDPLVAAGPLVLSLGACSKEEAKPAPGESTTAHAEDAAPEQYLPQDWSEEVYRVYDELVNMSVAAQQLDNNVRRWIVRMAEILFRSDRKQEAVV